MHILKIVGMSSENKTIPLDYESGRNVTENRALGKAEHAFCCFDREVKICKNQHQPHKQTVRLQHVNGKFNVPDCSKVFFSLVTGSKHGSSFLG